MLFLLFCSSVFCSDSSSSSGDSGVPSPGMSLPSQLEVGPAAQQNFDCFPEGCLVDVSRLSADTLERTERGAQKAVKRLRAAFLDVIGMPRK